MHKTLFICAMFVSSIVATSADAAPVIADKASVGITGITGTTATLNANLGFINRPTSSIYHFEYIEARMICPMIYPPIPACVPKKTADNMSPVTIKGLVPGKTYSVALITEDHAECVMVPCDHIAVECVMAPCDNIAKRIAETEFTTIAKTAAIVLALDIPKVGTSTATISLSDAAKSGILPDDLKRIYFTYQEANIFCKKDCSTQTLKSTSVTLTNLKPGTVYKVRAVKDSSIQCIKAPCPIDITYGDEFTFTTMGLSDTDTSITHVLRMGSRGEEVKTLQEFLISKGFMSGSASGYFGVMTLKSLKIFQKSIDLPPTGSTGPKTRAAINMTK